ncbi:hypothetical protein KA005_32620 [bacterium]|nr:hypothetical protein [bacterium]
MKAVVVNIDPKEPMFSSEVPENIAIKVSFFDDDRNIGSVVPIFMFISISQIPPLLALSR